MRFKYLLLVSSIAAGSLLVHTSHATSSHEQSYEECESLNIKKVVREKCFHEIDQYIDFLKEQQTFSMEQFKNGNIDYQYNLNEISDNYKILKKHKIWVENIEQNKSDALLNYFLQKRLEELEYFDRQLKEISRLKSFKIDEERLKAKYENMKTYYHFFNTMISSLYELTPPQELSYNTRFLIRVSPTLWDLLNKKTYDLGCPEAPFEENHDFALYQTYVQKSLTTQVPTYGLGVPKGSTTLQIMTPYEASMTDPKAKKIQNLFDPEWLQHVGASQKKEITQKKEAHDLKKN